MLNIWVTEAMICQFCNILLKWDEIFANLINRHKKVKELKESKIQLEMTANFISF